MKNEVSKYIFFLLSIYIETHFENKQLSEYIKWMKMRFLNFANKYVSKELYIHECAVGNN